MLNPVDSEYSGAIFLWNWKESHVKTSLFSLRLGISDDHSGFSKLSLSFYSFYLIIFLFILFIYFFYSFYLFFFFIHFIYLFFLFILFIFYFLL